ncbi:MAG: 3-dehydroquinate synthase [candidate division KSB1 bacterium]|nr:3-dehydroquinate synthase [candidate division KSB1 bacterium]MDZ7368735.1 3-dehydroquinate synthase [candidate division KSB1 bacterium]MDZ7406448.1 3-dehydroquinate synthase [candidate division KSB1 bacterium]
METLKVELGSRSYPIFIGTDSLAQLGELLKLYKVGERFAVITNTVVDRHYGEKILASLEAAKLRADKIVVADGERHKNLKTCERIVGEMLQRHCDRQTAVIALGGGVIGDLAGFVAATFMRGIEWVQTPTTLLAQVDASIGGKTGVNHPLGKNMIGAFHQPRLVWIDTATLNTLPPREIVCGLAEIVKHALIRDRQYFEFLETRLPDLLQLDQPAMIKAIHRSCQIKAEMVAQDERESAQRALLNFGHTVGHALEAAGGFRLVRHGEAVLLGMLAEAYLSCEADLLAGEAFTRIENFLKRLPQKRRLEGIAISLVEQCMALDKKVKHGQLRLVLLRDIGDAVVTADWPREKLARAIQYALS